MEKQQQFHLWYFVAAFLALMAFQSWFSTASVTERIPYSTFLEHLETDRISTVTVQSEQIQGRYREPIDGRTHFITNIVPDDLTRRLEQSSAEYDGTVENTFVGQLLSWVVPVALIFALWMFVFRRIAERQGFGGMMNVGKSRAKVYVEKDTGVTFDDVAGVDEAKAELKEIVDFLREPHSSVDLTREMFPHVEGPENIGFALGETLAHVNYLVRRGVVADISPNAANALYRVVG